MKLWTLKIRVVLSLSRVIWMLNPQYISHLQLLIEQGNMSDVCVLGKFCSWEGSTGKWILLLRHRAHVGIAHSEVLVGYLWCQTPQWLYFSVPLLVRLEHRSRWRLKGNLIDSNGHCLFPILHLFRTLWVLQMKSAKKVNSIFTPEYKIMSLFFLVIWRVFVQCFLYHLPEQNHNLSLSIQKYRQFD